MPSAAAPSTSDSMAYAAAVAGLQLHHRLQPGLQALAAEARLLMRGVAEALSVKLAATT